MRAGAGGVRRGRRALTTAPAHPLPPGLWLNVPDYDAPTALAKPRERNTRYVPAVVTVPLGALAGVVVSLLTTPQKKTRPEA